MNFVVMELLMVQKNAMGLLTVITHAYVQMDTFQMETDVSIVVTQFIMDLNNVMDLQIVTQQTVLVCMDILQSMDYAGFVAI